LQQLTILLFSPSKLLATVS